MSKKDKNFFLKIHQFIIATKIKFLNFFKKKRFDKKANIFKIIGIFLMFFYFRIIFFRICYFKLIIFLKKILSYNIFIYIF